MVDGGSYEAIVKRAEEYNKQREATDPAFKAEQDAYRARQAKIKAEGAAELAKIPEARLKMEKEFEARRKADEAVAKDRETKLKEIKDFSNKKSFKLADLKELQRFASDDEIVKGRLKALMHQIATDPDVQKEYSNNIAKAITDALPKRVVKTGRKVPAGWFDPGGQEEYASTVGAYGNPELGGDSERQTVIAAVRKAGFLPESVSDSDIIKFANQTLWEKHSEYTGAQNPNVNEAIGLKDRIFNKGTLTAAVLGAAAGILGPTMAETTLGAAGGLKDAFKAAAGGSEFAGNRATYGARSGLVNGIKTAINIAAQHPDVAEAADFFIQTQSDGLMSLPRDQVGKAFAQLAKETGSQKAAVIAEELTKSNVPVKDILLAHAVEPETAKAIEKIGVTKLTPAQKDIQNMPNPVTRGDLEWAARFEKDKIGASRDVVLPGVEKKDIRGMRMKATEELTGKKLEEKGIVNTVPRQFKNGTPKKSAQPQLEEPANGPLQFPKPKVEEPVPVIEPEAPSFEKGSTGGRRLAKAAEELAGAKTPEAKAAAQKKIDALMTDPEVQAGLRANDRRRQLVKDIKEAAAAGDGARVAQLTEDLSRSVSPPKETPPAAEPVQTPLSPDEEFAKKYRITEAARMAKAKPNDEFLDTVGLTKEKIAENAGKTPERIMRDTLGEDINKYTPEEQRQVAVMVKERMDQMKKVPLPPEAAKAAEAETIAARAPKEPKAPVPEAPKVPAPEAPKVTKAEDGSIPAMEPSKAPPPTGENKASIPVMITRQMKGSLRAMGVTEEEISNMTPQQAWDRMNSGIVTSSKPAAPKLFRAAKAAEAETIAAKAPKEPKAPAPEAPKAPAPEAPKVTKAEDGSIPAMEPSKAPPPTGENKASIPVMITRQMKGSLRAMGVTEEEISNMTPQQAWDRMNSGIVTSSKPAAPKLFRAAKPVKPITDSFVDAVEKQMTTDPKEARPLYRGEMLEFPQGARHAMRTLTDKAKAIQAKYPEGTPFKDYEPADLDALNKLKDEFDVFKTSLPELDAMRESQTFVSEGKAKAARDAMVEKALAEKTAAPPVATPAAEVKAAAVDAGKPPEVAKTAAEVVAPNRLPTDKRKGKKLLGAAVPGLIAGEDGVPDDEDNSTLNTITKVALGAAAVGALAYAGKDQIKKAYDAVSHYITRGARFAAPVYRQALGKVHILPTPTPVPAAKLSFVADDFAKVIGKNDLRAPDAIMPKVVDAIDHGAVPMRKSLEDMKEATYKALSGLTAEEDLAIRLRVDGAIDANGVPTAHGRTTYGLNGNQTFNADLEDRARALREILDKAYSLKWGNNRAHYRNNYFTWLNSNPAQISNPQARNNLMNLASRFWNQRTGTAGMSGASTAEVMDTYLNSVMRNAYLSEPIKAVTDSLATLARNGGLSKNQADYVQAYINMAAGAIDKPGAAEAFITRNLYRGTLWGNVASALINTTQLVNTAADVGLVNTGKGLAKMFNPFGTGWSGAREKGALELLDTEWMHSLRLMPKPAQRFMRSLDKVMMSPMAATESINRAVTFYAAHAEATSLGKTGADAVEYALSKVNRTMFNTSSTNVAPVFASSAAGRMARVLTQYPVRQATFAGGLAVDAIKGLKAGDMQKVLPFIRYLGLTGAVIGGMKMAGLDWGAAVDWAPGFNIARDGVEGGMGSNVRIPLMNPIMKTLAAAIDGDPKKFIERASIFLPGMVAINRFVENKGALGRGYLDENDKSASKKIASIYDRVRSGPDNKRPDPRPDVKEYVSDEEVWKRMLGLQTAQEHAFFAAKREIGNVNAREERKNITREEVEAVKDTPVPRPPGRPDAIERAYQGLDRGKRLVLPTINEWRKRRTQ